MFPRWMLSGSRPALFADGLIAMRTLHGPCRAQGGVDGARHAGQPQAAADSTTRFFDPWALSAILWTTSAGAVQRSPTTCTRYASAARDIAVKTTQFWVIIPQTSSSSTPAR